MAISADVISKAVMTEPIQPLFKTIYTSSLNAGIPVIVTNTNTNLTVKAKATIGSAPKGTAITDEMFEGSKSGFDVSGFTLSNDLYFTLLDLDSEMSELPNEFRTEAGGMDGKALREILVTIGNRISEQLLSNYFKNLQKNIVALVPTSNVTQGMAGKIVWNTLDTPESGQTSIASLIDDIIASLPLPMRVGGSAGSIVTAWVSANDFETMRNSTIEAYQYSKNGGLTTNYFQYVKQESSIDESRNMVDRSFVRYKNVIILPLNGMAEDSLVLTYQQGVNKASVYYDKVPAGVLNNWYMVIKGAFRRNDNLTLPIADDAQQIAFNLPYQVHKLLTINTVENAMNQYKVLGTLSNGVLFRESDKVFALLPDAAPTPPVEEEEGA